jgi:D-sedoheptulose 7-phosphate isomerase
MMTNQDKEIAADIIQAFESSIEVKRQVKQFHLIEIMKISELITTSLRSGNKLILFGNGGSAADSQHIAAELVNKFRRERKALAAVALTTDTSILTSISNDDSFDNVFARQLEAIGKEGDVALAFSTSGNSPNVLSTVNKAKELGISTIGFTGANGGKLKELVDLCFQVFSQSTPRIQEAHITVAHVICDVVEKELCAQNDK